jgi:putative HNH endonuclease
MKEIWRDIPNYEGRYKVSNHGQILCISKRHSGRFIVNHYRKDGTIYIKLHKNKSCETIDLAKLVATTFLGNPNGYLFVNHKDNNVKNCNVSNLFWSKTPWKIKDDHEEEWRDVKGYEGVYMVSNLANVKRVDNINKSVKPRECKNGRIVVNLSNGKRSVIGLEYIVATAFLPNQEDKRFVHFKDGDIRNCNAENLYWSNDENNFYTLEGEVWKDVIGYEGKYVVSSFGRIYSLTRERSNTGSIYKGRMLKLQECRKHYYVTLLDGCGNYKRVQVHRIVAKAFIPNPYNKPTIDHIDGNGRNNNINNLRWATMKENINNPNTLCHKTQLRSGAKNPMAQPVYGINIETGERLDFDCIKSATEFLGVKYQKYIGMCCKGTWKAYKGYLWHYV